MIIRPATLEDSAAVCRMAIRFLEETPYGELVTPNEVKIAQLMLQCLDLGVIYVAELEDAPPHTLVGFLALVALAHPVSGDPFAEELAWWVQPEARHLSVGPRLLAHGERWAIAHALRMLKMVAPAASSVGGFYERRGYRLVELTYCKTLLGSSAPQPE